MRNLMQREDGQDLIEYALLGAIIAVGAVAVMGNLAAAIVALLQTIVTDL
jgi:Flp pilus assembly pilin Flp